MNFGTFSWKFTIKEPGAVLRLSTQFQSFARRNRKVESEKSTTVNICLTILAFFYESDLREEDDFYVTTTSRGRRNYHP